MYGIKTIAGIESKEGIWRRYEQIRVDLSSFIRRDKTRDYDEDEIDSNNPEAVAQLKMDLVNAVGKRRLQFESINRQLKSLKNKKVSYLKNFMLIKNQKSFVFFSVLQKIALAIILWLKNSSENRFYRKVYSEISSTKK